jgi:septal ring factor EnvC (AmiA/AmiB activator)
MVMKMVWACLIVLFLSVPAFAQQEPPSAQDIIAKIQSKLNLTQDQVAAITPIVEKYSSKFAELHQNIENGSADHDSMRAQMKQLKEAEKQELSQVLSVDQLSQWGQMQGKHKHKSDGDDNGAPAPPEDNASGSQS